MLSFDKLRTVPRSICTREIRVTFGTYTTISHVPLTFFLLIWTFFKVKVFNFIEYKKVVFRYYRSIPFAKVDIALLFSYMMNNPYRICRKFQTKKGEVEVYTYGETPLTTLENIVKECEITPNDVVYELGCGRGRTCFWLSQFFGCTVIGIDYVPLFIEKAKRLKQQLNLQHVFFRLEDIMVADLKGASVIYIYGIFFTPEQIAILIERMSKLSTNVKIITISYALTDIHPKAPFRVLKQFPVLFAWGKTDAFLQVIKRRGGKTADSA